MNKLFLLPFFALILLFTACGSDYVLKEKKEFSSEGWTYADSLQFKVDISDTLKIYNLFLEVRHSTEYSFQNLYTQIHTQFPKGQRIKEVVSLELADKAGVWFGNCNSEYCTILIPIQEGAFFNIPGSYQFTLEQFMRKDPLPGVQSITFMIEDTGVSR